MKINNFIILLSSLLFLFVSCKENNNIKVRSVKSQNFNYESTDTDLNTSKTLSTDLAKVYKLSNSMHIKILAKEITLFKKGRLYATNTGMLIGSERTSCLSEGFWDLTSKIDNFTIQIRTCSNRYFIMQELTFLLDINQDKVPLRSVTYQYTDRQDVTLDIPDRIIDYRDFGTLYFEDIDTASLLDLESH